MKIKNFLLTFVILLAIFAVGSASQHVNAATNKPHFVSLPAKFRHNWHGAFFNRTAVYKIHKNYGYYTDDYKKNGKNHYIKYRFTKLGNGEYGAYNKNTESAPFKMSGNHLIVSEDTFTIKMSRGL
ncbi:hypothetical protein ACYATO_09145 [Lactobacillaceae bacterium Melli_B3]